MMMWPASLPPESHRRMARPAAWVNLVSRDLLREPMTTESTDLMSTPSPNRSTLETIRAQAHHPPGLPHGHFPVESSELSPSLSRSKWFHALLRSSSLDLELADTHSPFPAMRTSRARLRSPLPFLRIFLASSGEGASEPAMDRAMPRKLSDTELDSLMVELKMTTLWPSPEAIDRKSTRLNSSHVSISYAVFC